MKTNIKMRVTKEQSKRVQEICFENKIRWSGEEEYNVSFTDKPFLYIDDKYLKWGIIPNLFILDVKEEVDADLFIRTNGTCKESVYPMRFFNLKYKFIVEFTSLNIGKVVETSKKSGYEVGHFSEMWVSHTDTNIWKKMEEPKQIKNNFKDYGFEADFEGEILAITGDYYIGYYIENYPRVIEKQKIPTFWNKNTGNCYKGAGVSNSKFSLKPIKKEWFENPDNFPCIVLDRNYNMFLAKGIDIDNFLTQEFNKQIGHIKHFRPATKEEILKLVVNV